MLLKSYKVIKYTYIHQYVQCFVKKMIKFNYMKYKKNF